MPRSATTTGIRHLRHGSTPASTIAVTSSTTSSNKAAACVSTASSTTSGDKGRRHHLLLRRHHDRRLRPPGYLIIASPPPRHRFHRATLYLDALPPSKALDLTLEAGERIESKLDIDVHEIDTAVAFSLLARLGPRFFLVGVACLLRLFCWPRAVRVCVARPCPSLCLR